MVCLELLVNDHMHNTYLMRVTHRSRSSLLLVVPHSNDQMSKPLHIRGRFPGRSLQGIKADYQRFMVEGQGNLKKARLFNNTILNPFFDIAIDKVFSNIKSVMPLDIHQKMELL